MICSDNELKLQEIEHLKHVLSISGYTKSSWVTANRPKPPTVQSDPAQNCVKESITLPYGGPMTVAISRIIHKAGVQVHIKPYNTIRGHLVHPKDKENKVDKTGVVYHIQCSD